MNLSKPAKILNQKGLSVTGIREKLIDIFIQANKPLSKTEIDSLSNKWADRVTIYRNLYTLCENNILRKISAEDGGVYLLINSKEKKIHLHFQCKKCHKVYCLPDIEIDQRLLPKNYKIETIEFIATGICEKCLYMK